MMMFRRPLWLHPTKGVRTEQTANRVFQERRGRPFRLGKIDTPSDRPSDPKYLHSSRTAR